MDQQNPKLLLQEAAAALLSRVKEGSRTTQKAIDNIVCEMNKVTKLYIEVLKDSLRLKLSSRDGYISLKDVNSVLQPFQSQSVFEGVNTSDKMNDYLREKSGGKKVVLKQAVVKWKVVLFGGIPKKVPHLFGYCVPFLAQLQQLLNCEDVLYCVDHPLPSQKGVFRTVTDGLFYKHHPVVLEHGPQTLAIVIHTDDAEICDALKSKANKNTLRLFYWMLANIFPEKRATLRAINLLAIANAKVAKKFGNSFLLEDFVTAMEQLGTEGVDFTVNGKTRRFYAVLVFAACDMPAAANLGRFKETHSALRPCRQCMVLKSDMCNNFRESPRLLRKLPEHNQQLSQVMAQLKEPVAILDIYEESCHIEEEEYQEVYADHKDPSINFGINGKSVLSRIPHFDVTKCLPQDLMHLLNEGIVELVCRRLLRELCLPPKKNVKPLLHIDQLNTFIGELCNFGHLSAEKPSYIDIGHIKGAKLKQSASQMLVLMRILPMIIYNRLPDEKLQLLLKLIHVVDACMAFQFTQADIQRLEDLIADFGSHFIKLYPELKTLKLHCTAHLPTQVLLHGPLRQQWNFRFEGFHFYFTSIFSIVRNMKNPSLTAALRHLSSRNAEIIQRGNHFLTDEDTIVLSNRPVLAENLPKCIHELPSVSFDKVSEVKEFEHCGRKWKEGIIILVDEGKSLFGRISRIFKIEENLFILFNYLNTEFIASYNAFEVSRCLQEDNVILFNNLQYKFPILRFSFSLKNRLKVYIMKEKPVECY